MVVIIITVLRTSAEKVQGSIKGSQCEFVRFQYWIVVEIVVVACSYEEISMIPASSIHVKNAHFARPVLRRRDEGLGRKIHDGHFVSVPNQNERETFEGGFELRKINIREHGAKEMSNLLLGHEKPRCIVST